jgi:predicted RNA-binding protein YlxR (DUF448 family)
MEMKPKLELIRIVKEPNGNVLVDTTGKKNGRGAYICQSTDCLKKAIKTRKLQRTFDSEIAEDIIASLEREMK